MRDLKTSIMNITKLMAITRKLFGFETFLRKTVQGWKLKSICATPRARTIGLINKEKNVVNTVFGRHATPPRQDNFIHTITWDPTSAITFTDAYYEGINHNHTEAPVVLLDLTNNEVKRILVDNGSPIDIFFKHAWDRLKLESYKLEPCPNETSIYGFGHNAVPIVGIARLPLCFGE